MALLAMVQAQRCYYEKLPYISPISRLYLAHISPHQIVLGHDADYERLALKIPVWLGQG